MLINIIFDERENILKYHLFKILEVGEGESIPFYPSPLITPLVNSNGFRLPLATSQRPDGAVGQVEHQVPGPQGVHAPLQPRHKKGEFSRIFFCFFSTIFLLTVLIINIFFQFYTMILLLQNPLICNMKKNSKIYTFIP